MNTTTEPKEPKILQVRTTPELNRKLNRLCKAMDLRKSPVIFTAVNELYERKFGRDAEQIQP